MKILLASLFLAALSLTTAASDIDEYKGVISKTDDPCSQDVCSAYPNTKCVPKTYPPNVHSFECLCASELFVTFKPDDTKGAHNQRMQHCTAKDLCKDEATNCADKNGTICSSVVQLEGDTFVGHTFCVCAATKQILADRSLSCAQTCQNECPNAASCATVYQGAASNSTVVCNCKEGWTGGHCEKKVVIPEEKSTGGLVAAVIILSILAAVALIAVGGLVYLMKRR